MVIADIRTGQILVLDRGLSATDFLPLNITHIGQHAQIAEITFRQNIRAKRCFVIGRQGNQMVENTGFTRRISLEVLD